jgi:ATP-dependent DNA helicase RecQ
MPGLDFDSLHDVLSSWPTADLPVTGSDGLFDRVRQILATMLLDGAGMGDLIPLLRQVLRRQSHRMSGTARLRVPAASGWPDRQRWADFGVRAQALGSGQFLIEAYPWSPVWQSDCDNPLFEDMFGEREVRRDWRRPMDPFLTEVSGFAAYMSPGQREAVRSAFLMPAGETLIVSLPTGSGKSLVAQGPVLVQGLEGGLSICVVPTTALVLDQARQTTKMLEARHPRRTLPSVAWHANLSPEERSSIKTAIREGRQGILFCSPEALTGALLPALYDAARDGLLSYLVIDEAHLVSQWGDGFRPAFQMMAGTRRGLLEACGDSRFRTILMSATLTPDTIDTIDALFGPAQKIQMVASIHLRPEPQYWIHKENNEASKERKVLEAIRHAPRPFILYVTKREDARLWLKRLRQAGFSRTECFHGDTPDVDRRRIINEWSQNKIDGIVATSAFGVGIDKADVRAVIHATVPETLDRFYQEVGRGGRDGRSAASLLLYSDADREIADNLGSPTLISDELAFERWSAMFARSKSHDAMGGLLEIDIDAVPPRLRQESDYNAAWNMRTLIMMARARMIDLESKPPELISRLETETEAAFDLRNEEHWATFYKRVMVSILKHGHLNRETFFRDIGEERSRSSSAATLGRKLLDELLSGETEFASLLDRLYRNHTPGRSLIVSPACGGCPVHRRSGTAELLYSEPLAYGIERVDPRDSSLFGEQFPHLDLRSPVLIPFADSDRGEDLIEVLGDLVATFGIREIAVPQSLLTGSAGLRRLHSKAADGILVLNSLEEERIVRSSYRVARATLLSEGGAWPHVFFLDRPLHIILLPGSMPDPFHHGRLLVDTGTNVLPMDQFKLGARS